MKRKSTGSRKKLPPIWAEKVARLEEVVANEFGRELDELWSSSRELTSVWARWVIWHYMLKWKIPSIQISRYCGFSHSSALYGSNKLTFELTYIDELREMFLNVSEQMNTP